jgi:hypothetical protein
MAYTLVVSRQHHQFLCQNTILYVHYNNIGVTKVLQIKIQNQKNVIHS